MGATSVFSLVSHLTLAPVTPGSGCVWESLFVCSKSQVAQTPHSFTWYTDSIATAAHTRQPRLKRKMKSIIFSIV
uniref:Putative secreted protein n=1 Tax=Anopheles darlingi TaxID=43151 RepID=A0A2M4DQX5_ANODA